MDLTTPHGCLVQPILTNYLFPTKYLHTLYDVQDKRNTPLFPILAFDIL